MMLGHMVTLAGVSGESRMPNSLKGCPRLLLCFLHDLVTHGGHVGQMLQEQSGGFSKNDV